MILDGGLITTALCGGSGSANIKSLAITEPGIYTIEAEDCDGYAPINVNVLPAVSTMPLTAVAGNTYHASDYEVDGFDPVEAVGSDKDKLYDIITGNTEEIPLPSGDTVDGVVVGSDVWDSIGLTCGNDTTVVDTANNIKIRIYAEVKENTDPVYSQYLKNYGKILVEYTDLTTGITVTNEPRTQTIGPLASLQGWKIDSVTSQSGRITVVCSRNGFTVSNRQAVPYTQVCSTAFNGTFDPNHMVMTDYTVTAW